MSGGQIIVCVHLVQEAHLTAEMRGVGDFLFLTLFRGTV